MKRVLLLYTITLLIWNNCEKWLHFVEIKQVFSL